MLAPSTTQQIEVDGAEFEGTLQPGDPVSSEISVSNDGLVAMVVIFDQPGGDAHITDTRFALSGGDSITTTLSVDAPPPDVQRTVTITEHRYLLVLPASLIESLHDIYPLFALAAVNVILGGAILALVAGLLGVRKRRLRNTSREIQIRRRLRRLFR